VLRREGHAVASRPRPPQQPPEDFAARRPRSGRRRRSHGVQARCPGCARRGGHGRAPRPGVRRGPEHRERSPSWRPRLDRRPGANRVRRRAARPGEPPSRRLERRQDPPHGCERGQAPGLLPSGGVDRAADRGPRARGRGGLRPRRPAAPARAAGLQPRPARPAAIAGIASGGHPRDGASAGRLGSRRAQGGVSGRLRGRGGVARLVSRAHRRESRAVDPSVGRGRLRELSAPDRCRLRRRSFGRRRGTRRLERGSAPLGRGAHGFPARPGPPPDGSGDGVLRPARRSSA
jgi:hypothetical protein